MGMLSILWWTSLVFAGAALSWMTALVIGRKFRERRDARSGRDRALAHAVFMEIMTGAGDAVARLRGIRTRAQLMAEALLEILSLVRGAERERLISALSAIGLDEQFRRRLFRGGVSGRIASAESLASFPGEDTVRALNRALTETRHANFRVVLLQSLIDLGAPPPLGSVLSGMREHRGADSLLYLPVIRRLVADDPTEALRRFADPGVGPESRAVLAEALGSSGDWGALAPLCESVDAGEPAVRIAALRGLAAMGHPAAEPPVLRALEDPDWQVRAAACEAVGRIGLRDAVPLLVEQLANPEWWVRFRAGEALAALGPVGLAALHEAAHAGTERASRAASLVLAEKGIQAEAA